MSISRYASVADLNNYTIKISKCLNNTPLNALRKAIAVSEGYQSYKALCNSIEKKKKSRIKLEDLIGVNKDLPIIFGRNLEPNTFDEELDILAG